MTKNTQTQVSEDKELLERWNGEAAKAMWLAAGFPGNFDILEAIMNKLLAAKERLVKAEMEVEIKKWIFDNHDHLPIVHGSDSEEPYVLSLDLEKFIETLTQSDMNNQTKQKVNKKPSDGKVIKSPKDLARARYNYYKYWLKESQRTVGEAYDEIHRLFPKGDKITLIALKNIFDENDCYLYFH